MLNFVLSIILWTLAIYGLYEIIKTVINSYLTKKVKLSNAYLVIIVKNGENYIEYLTRKAIIRKVIEKANYIKEIIIIDLNSEDETSKIIRKLEKDYNFIKVLNKEEINKFFSSITDS